MTATRRLAFVVPGSIATRSGGYEYDRRIIEGLRALGWSVDLHETAALAPIEDGTLTIVDGLALGTIPDEAERHAKRLSLIALVHLPLAHDLGLDSDTAASLWTSERRALAVCRRVIVTGRSTVDAVVEEYGAPRDKVVVVEPGTRPAAVASGSGGPDVHLLCVAAVTVGKGHEVLIEALARIASLNWRLTCAGSLDREPLVARRVQAVARGRQLDSRITFTGELGEADLERAYDAADVFVLPTLHETYGMAVAEALAHGLPVVSTTTGAIPDLLRGGAGVVVKPNDAGALADALSKTIADAAFRSSLADAARRTRARLTTWEAATGRMAAMLDALVHDDQVSAL